MARMTKREQWRAWVEQWRRAGPELERFHAEELRAYRYDSADADAVLEMGDFYKGPPRLDSGLVEMQRLFMKAAFRQGLLPAVQAVREDAAGYGGAAVPPALAILVATGRLTIRAPFPDKVRRVTAATCAKRNRIVADMADAALIAAGARAITPDADWLRVLKQA